MHAFHPSIVALALASATTLAGAATYRAQDLGNLGASSVSVAGMNASGQVIGQSARAGGALPHAFATGPAGAGMVDLCASLPDNACGATAINMFGEVVGWIDNGLSFVVNADGTSFQTVSGARLVSINYDHSVAANVVVDDNGKTRAAVAYNPFGPYHQISSLTGTGGQSTATDMSDKVVGCSLTALGQTHAFRAKSRVTKEMDDLGTLGGPNSCATALDTDDNIVGYADTPDGTHAFFRGKKLNPMKDLGTLGGTYSAATGAAIGTKHHQHVVGYSTIGADAQLTHAFVYDMQKGRMIDINTLVDLPGVTFDRAMAINGLDQIAATSSDGRAWLLTPIDHH